MAWSSKVKRIIDCGNKLFSDRMPVLGLWQTMADNFYPERADFTTTRSLGTEFANGLQTGFPVMARRDLANSVSAMLRPRGKPWFYARTEDEKIDENPENRRWLDDKTEVMRRMIYDRGAQFIRATKEGDNDFVTFGQAVIHLDLNRAKNGLLFRTYHLRDVVWLENAELEIDQVHRNWELSAQQLVDLFPSKVDERVRTMTEKTPEKTVKCRHIIVPSHQYELTNPSPFRRRPLPFVSLYVDLDHETVLEEVAIKRVNYIIPRWQTVSGSQYAHSPATVVGLSDARMLQQITLTLLEAGQKAVDPPLLAVGEAINGGVNLYAGGITWVDAEYDERLGEVLRPVSDRKDGLNWGVDREERICKLIQSAFYLDQIHLPSDSGAEKMSATETQIRYEEYMRRALPLFEPMEMEYNGAICDMVFDIGFEHGAFGPLNEIPEALRGQDIKFAFESPIQEASGRANAQAFQTSAQLLAIAAQIDPSSIHTFNTSVALRDALEGAGAPADWIAEDQDAAQKAQDAQDEMEAQQEMMAAQQIATTAKDGTAAVQNVAGAAQKGAQAAQMMEGPQGQAQPGSRGVTSRSAMARAPTPDVIQEAMDALGG